MRNDEPTTRTGFGGRGKTKVVTRVGHLRSPSNRHLVSLCDKIVYGDPYIRKDFAKVLAMFSEPRRAGYDRLRLRKPVRSAIFVKHLRYRRLASILSPHLSKPTAHQCLVFFGHSTLQCAELTSRLPALSGENYYIQLNTKASWQDRATSQLQPA